ncbi:MAG: hypothetical protein NZ898_08750 [Myxococcota bacterium]|nr:hypothetical protein [Myxococcota bacterium]
MPYGFRRVPWVLVSGWLGVGCGCGSPSRPSDAGPPLDGPAADVEGPRDGGSDAAAGSIRDFCEPLARGICERAGLCGCGAALPGGRLDVEGCANRLAVACARTWGEMSEDAVVDAERAARCAETILERTPRCGVPLLVVLAACEPFIVSAVGVGEPCAAGFCAGGMGVCLDGRCEPRMGEGAACESPLQCERGLVCVEGRCRRALAEGASGCRLDFDCEAPLVCAAGRCVRPAAEGAACADRNACAEGLRCVDGRCARAPSEPCATDEACASRTRCWQPSTCRPRAGRGAACREDRDCNADLYCDGGSGRCAERPAVDEPCADEVICAPELACDSPSGGRCRLAPVEGQPCAFGRFGPNRCGPGLTCVAGTCRTPPGEGEACGMTDDTFVCREGLGCAFGPSGSTCRPLAGEGAACESSQTCQAHLHCSREGRCARDVETGAPCDPSLDDCAGACVLDATAGYRCQGLQPEGAACRDAGDCADGLSCTARPDDARCLAEICGVLTGG